MQAETIIYGAAALSVSVCLGTLAAFFWSERRWRKREQWLASLCALDEPVVPRHPTDEAEPPTIPITRRPFHEALWEDEPDLAPSPQARAIVQDLDASRRGDKASLTAQGNEPAKNNRENEEMLKQIVGAATALTAAGALSACTPPKPEFKSNPDATRRYEIRVAIHNAPGRLIVTGGTASYQAFDCAYVVNAVAGAYGQPEWALPVAYRQIDENTYVGTFHVDGMQDEDYDGPGGSNPCHWKFMGVGSSMQATGASGETRFITYMSAEDVLAGNTITKHYRKAFYPKNASISNFKAFGLIDGESTSPGIAAADVFSVTLSVKKVEP